MPFVRFRVRSLPQIVVLLSLFLFLVPCIVIHSNTRSITFFHVSRKSSLSRETSNAGYNYNYFELDGRAQSLTGVCVPSPCSPFRAPPENESTSKVIRVCSKDAAARSQRDSSSSSSESERRVELLCSDGVTYFYSVADQSPSGIAEVEKQVNTY